MKSKFGLPIILSSLFTLVGGESVERFHIKEPAKHVDTERHEPLDAGKFRTVTVVTTTGVSSGHPQFLRSM